MPNEGSSLPIGARRVGPLVLLGLISRFLQRAFAVATEDERIRALLLWGSLARGDADEWSHVDLVAAVSDDSVPEVIDEFSRANSPYGQSLVTLQTPQDGVEGGGHVSVTYLVSGVPLRVDWYVCPKSLGLPVRDTKPLFTLDGWPNSGTSFAEFLRSRPSRQSVSSSSWDILVSEIPTHVKEVARGRWEAVLVDGKPASDPVEAYEELDRRIARLPDEYSDIRPPLFNYVGIARQCKNFA